VKSDFPRAHRALEGNARKTGNPVQPSDIAIGESAAWLVGSRAW
jgi:hypothetical protein